MAADVRKRPVRHRWGHPLQRNPAGLRPAIARGGDRQPAPGRRRLPVLRRHQQRLLRPGLPRRARLPDARFGPAALLGRHRGPAEQPDRFAGGADSAEAAGRVGLADLNSSERSVVSSLSSWNYSMGADSTAATVWWTFWGDYLSEVFEPWWKAGHVPVGRDSDGLAVGPGLVPLDEDLQAWTLTSPDNPAFRRPGPGTATPTPRRRWWPRSARRSPACHRRWADRPQAWTWGRVARPGVPGRERRGRPRVRPTRGRRRPVHRGRGRRRR